MSSLWGYLASCMPYPTPFRRCLSPAFLNRCTPPFTGSADPLVIEYISDWGVPSSIAAEPTARYFYTYATTRVFANFAHAFRTKAVSSPFISKSPRSTPTHLARNTQQKASNIYPKNRILPWMSSNWEATLFRYTENAYLFCSPETQWWKHVGFMQILWRNLPRRKPSTGFLLQFRKTQHNRITVGRSPLPLL